MIPSVPSSPLTETFLPLVHIFAKLRLEYFSRLAKRSESAQLLPVGGAWSHFD